MFNFVTSTFGILFLGLVVFLFIIICVINHYIRTEEQKILSEALKSINITQTEIDKVFKDYQRYEKVKSRQTLEKYDYARFFKDNRDMLNNIGIYLNRREEIINKFEKFLVNNEFKERRFYSFVEDYLQNHINLGVKYVLLVSYISTAGNCLASKRINMDKKLLGYYKNNPELYITKTELKSIEKERLEKKKSDTYDIVNQIIDKANYIKDSLIIKEDKQLLDDLIANLFDRTVNSVAKIKQIAGAEWSLINNVINATLNGISEIEIKNKKLFNYYNSKEFATVKKSCEKLMESQKEFNQYIDEKINSLSKMFGTRTIRNETKQEDVYNYVRTYKKTISPFTAEVSSTVFASAENNPIQYLIKLFYPNKVLYQEQIYNLKNLLNELETLKEAKNILNINKQEYVAYLETVPSYVLQYDEDGFYSRLGFAVIDENILNVEYKINYTSGGGMAQRSFSIPMTEKTIGELIIQLQDKLTTAALAKEQRALMTPKLREEIKKRDNYTCCMCGNSTFKEPNLLLEIDHITPIAKGGLTVESNLQTLCWKCNRNKGAKIIN